MAATYDANLPTSTPAGEDDVVVGLVLGPSGLNGDLKVEVLTEFPARFAPGSVLYLRGRRTRVERSRNQKASLVVKLDLVTDRAAAESLRGEYLTVPQHQVDRLPHGSYYHFQIMGMSVWSEDGESLGSVKEILSTAGNDVYVVADDAGEDLLIPAIADVVLDVDPGSSRMTVRIPEGLR